MTERTSSGTVGLGGGEDGPVVTPESLPRQVGRQLVRRWKSLAAVATTGLTAWWLYGVDGGWSADAIAFTLFAVSILGYTAFTLYTDLEPS